MTDAGNSRLVGYGCEQKGSELVGWLRKRYVSGSDQTAQKARRDNAKRDGLRSFRLGRSYLGRTSFEGIAEPIPKSNHRSQVSIHRSRASRRPDRRVALVLAQSADAALRAHAPDCGPSPKSGH